MMLRKQNQDYFFQITNPFICTGEELFLFLMYLMYFYKQRKEAEVKLLMDKVAPRNYFLSLLRLLFLQMKIVTNRNNIYSLKLLVSSNLAKQQVEVEYVSPSCLQSSLSLMKSRR